MPSTFIEVRNQYQEKADALAQALTIKKRHIRNISIFRLAVFLLTILGIYIGSGYGWIAVIPTGVLGFGFFIFLLIRHSRLFRERRWLQTLLQINHTEMNLLDGNTDGQDKGVQFSIPNHPFSVDLDVFGDRSLLQLIDRSATLGGRKSLAGTLNHPILEANLLSERQQAIRELSTMQDWRQKFQASGILGNEKPEEISELISWTKSMGVSFDKPFYWIMLFLNPLLGFGVSLLIILNQLNFGAFVLFLILPFGIIGLKLSSISKEHSLLSKKSGILDRFSELLEYTLDAQFTANLLRQLQKKLTGNKQSATGSVQKLSKISAAFDYRLNLLAGLLLNIFFLWDILQLIRLERWKHHHGQELEIWFQVLYQVDELNSFAGFAYNHPESVYPEFSMTEFEIYATNAKHPFIERSKSVGNPIIINGWKDFQVITGANMAGKSTYLRTVGVNLLLGMTGAPVLADTFRFKPATIFTSIRTSDSLQDGESYFFAELKRLKQLIDLLEKDTRAFIILDEILRGTNSADKRKGSRSLIRQLLKLGASGMIATHDLALGELADDFPENIQNKRFEVEIVDSDLHFDYKLKEGISRNLNATFLMRKMGITVD